MVFDLSVILRGCMHFQRISNKKEDNISVDIGGLMKLITPFTILNRKFNEMDLIRDAMKKRKLATERLHDDYRKMYKTHQFA